MKSGGIKGTPASLPEGWININGYLVGPRADLSDAILKNTNLKSLNLQEVNLQGADLYGANLEGVRSGHVQGEPRSLPEGWFKVNGYLIGP